MQLVGIAAEGRNLYDGGGPEQDVAYCSDGSLPFVATGRSLFLAALWPQKLVKCIVFSLLRLFGLFGLPLLPKLILQKPESGVTRYLPTWLNTSRMFLKPHFNRFEWIWAAACLIIGV